MSNHPRPVVVAPVSRERYSSLEPLTEAVVALNIAGHREELHRNTRPAINLAASCIFAFHEEISGSLTTALRSRSESYAREQGTGKRALTVEDICELVVAGGAEGRNAVRALLAPIVGRLDGSGSGVGVSEAAADFLHEACDVPNALMLGKTDSEIRREIVEARERLRIFEQALESRARVSSRVAQVIGGKQ